MPIEMERVIYRVFIDGLSMTEDLDQLSKCVQAGIGEIYYEFSPWNVVIGPDFGASITYQLDTCIYFKLIDRKVLIWSSKLKQRVKRVFLRTKTELTEKGQPKISQRTSSLKH